MNDARKPVQVDFKRDLDKVKTLETLDKIRRDEVAMFGEATSAHEARLGQIDERREVLEYETNPAEYIRRKVDQGVAAALAARLPQAEPEVETAAPRAAKKATKRGPAKKATAKKGGRAPNGAIPDALAVWKAVKANQGQKISVYAKALGVEDPTKLAGRRKKLIQDGHLKQTGERKLATYTAVGKGP